MEEISTTSKVQIFANFGAFEQKMSKMHKN